MRGFVILPLFVLGVTAGPAVAKRIAAPPPPLTRALQSDATVVGKVTTIEKETVSAAPGPGAPKVDYRVAVIKLDAGLIGASNVTHVKVGFIPPPVGPDGNPLPRRGYQPVALSAGQEGMFFLTRHPTAGFYVIAPMQPPVVGAGDAIKAEVARVKQASAVLADPMKALKAAKAEDRSFAATVMVTRYRAFPTNGGEVERVAIPVEESRLILKGLAEADWAMAAPGCPAPINCFYQLGLTNQDGWVQPKPQPGGNYTVQIREAFAKWADGPGKMYQIKKNVPKAK